MGSGGTMSRNYGFGAFKATSKASMNWPGTHPKINGGFITPTTKRGMVIPFPRHRAVQNWEWFRLGRHQYRVRPGSWADRIWQAISVLEE